MTIKPLKVEVTGQTTQFESAMGRAQRGLRGLSVAAASAAGAVTGAMTAMAISGIGLARDITVLSQRANATPRELQRLSAGARTAGVNMEGMSNVLQDVNDRIGDFLTTGAGPMADFFERIGSRVGVTAADFRNLSGPQALQLYVNTLQEAGASQQEFTFFMESLSGEATRLLPLLMNNGAEMRRFGDAAEAAGQIIGDSMLDRIMKANEALTTISNTFDSLRLRLAAEVSPAIEAVANSFSSFMASAEAQEAIDGLTASLSSMLSIVSSPDFLQTAISAMTGLVNVIGQFSEGIIWASNNIGTFTAAAAGIGTAITIAGGPISLIVIAIGAVVTGLVVMASRIRETFGSLGNAMSMVKDVVSEVFDRMNTRWVAFVTGMAGGIETVKSGFFGMTEAVANAVSGAVGAVASGVASIANSALEGLEKMVNKAIEGINILISGINAIPGINLDPIGSFEATRVTLDGATEGIDRIREGLTGLREEADANSASLGGLADLLVELSGQPLESVQALRDAIAGEAFGGRSRGAGGNMPVPGLLPGFGEGVGDGSDPNEDSGGGGGGGGSVADQMRQRLEALTQGMQTEAEALMEWYEEGRQLLADALEARLITEQEYLERRTQLEQEYARRSNQIEELRNQNNFAAVSGGINDILSAAAQGNDKIMRVQRAFAAGMAWIDTLQGAARMLRAGTFGFAAAAAVIAKGIGFIAAINSTGTKSRGGVGGGVAGGGRAAEPVAMPTQTVRFDFGGNGGMAGEELVNMINDAYDRGYRIRGIIA